ncbi:MAG: sugar phosphate isomerase/epimerase family protein [Candidatus Latescibacterota bacterium]
MVTLSAFADEISADLTEQITVLEREGIRNIDLRSVWGKGVLDLDYREQDMIQFALDQNEFDISSIGSPIGKVAIDGDFGVHMERYKRAIEMAHLFGCDYIRLFSFYMPEGKDPADYRDEVMRRFQVMADLAQEEGVVLLHENERGIYGDTAERCKDLIDTIDSPSLRVVFDPANFITVGQHPYERCLPILKDDIERFHIKDAIFSSGEVKPAGEGEGQIPRMLSEMIADGFEGFLSIEPHLLREDKKQAFHTAASALKKILRDIGVAYD